METPSVLAISQPSFLQQSSSSRCLSRMSCCTRQRKIYNTAVSLPKMSAACSLTPFCLFHKLSAAIKAPAYRSIFLSSVLFLNNSLPLPPLQLSNSCSVVSLTREKIWRPPVIQTHAGVCALHFLEGSVQLCKGPQLTRVTRICLISRWTDSLLLLLKCKCKCKTFLFGDNPLPFHLLSEYLFL